MLNKNKTNKKKEAAKKIVEIFLRTTKRTNEWTKKKFVINLSSQQASRKNLFTLKWLILCKIASVCCVIHVQMSVAAIPNSKANIQNKQPEKKLCRLWLDRIREVKSGQTFPIIDWWTACILTTTTTTTNITTITNVDI